MAIYVSKNGDIHFYKGDSGNIIFKGLPTDKNYTVYFAVKNPENSETIGNELVVSSNFSDTVAFSLSTEYTDKFDVEQGVPFCIYNYGLKICSGGDEYTLIPKVEIKDDYPIFKPAPKVIVHQKCVEGE